MRWGFRTKLFLASAGLIATAVVCADVYLTHGLNDQWGALMRNDLAVRLTLVGGQVEGHGAALNDFGGWDSLADELGRRSATRVTVVRGDGVVIGDSEVGIGELPGIDNHATRPEVAEAMRTGHGASERMSATVGRRMLYQAAAFSRAGQRVGVVRVALSLTEVDQAIDRLHRVLATGSVLALVLALLISSIVAHMMTRGLRDVTRVTRRMAKGDLEARVHLESGDELGDLGRTLNQVVANLSGTLGALRAERDRLGQILEAMDEGVLVADAGRTIVLANSALRMMLLAHVEPGYTAEPDHPTDLVGRPLADVVRNAELAVIIESTLSSAAPVTGEIEVGIHRLRRLLVHAAPLSGVPAGCVVVFVDVTEIRRLEAVRRDFVANVSHELRTPVTALRTGVETARSALLQDPASAERFLEMAERNAERLVSLLNDLLDLSRIESGHFKLELECVDVGAVVAQVVLLFRGSAGKRKTRVARELPDNLPAVRADRQALEHVLANLVDNAVKYSGDNGEISIAAKAAGAAVLISVSDNGPGIEARHLPRLFERFYRVDEGRSRDRGGTGLGLAIVKHLVEAMGGAVSVESAPGRGTAVTVKLPQA